MPPAQASMRRWPPRARKPSRATCGMINEGWYADYDLKSKKVRNQLTAAALFPLYVKAAAQDRAEKVAAATASRLLKPGGIATTTVNSGQQWDAPNGWAPAANGWPRKGCRITGKRRSRWM